MEWELLGGLGECAYVGVCVCVCMCEGGGEEKGSVQILLYTTICTCEWVPNLDEIHSTSLDVYTIKMHTAVSLCTAGDNYQSFCLCGGQ